MTPEQKEIVSNLKKKYIKEKDNLMKYRGDLSTIVIDGTISLFSVYDSKQPHFFAVTSHSNKDIKELFDYLRKAYMVFSGDDSIDSGA